jgi:NADH-quinone oxidoreductase subunit D
MNESTLVQTLAAHFPDTLLDYGTDAGTMTLTVSPERLVDICGFLRDEPEAQYNLLATLTRAHQNALYQLVSLPRTERLLLRVPLPEGETPALDSVSFVWPAANWAEREAHDLWNLTAIGHPDLTPLLRARDDLEPTGPETDQGLELCGGTRYPTSVDGLCVHVDLSPRQRIVRTTMDLSHRHSGLEARLAKWPYRRGTLLAARADGFAAMSCDLAYALAVERLLQITPPPRAQMLRTVYAELQRIASHLFWLARCAQNLADPPFAGPAYAWQGRMAILDLFQELGGNPITPDVITIGGLKRDTAGSLRSLLATLQGVLDDVDRLLTHGPGFRAQLEGVGVIDPGTALGLGVTGPCLRACGIGYDVRSAFPYAGYAALHIQPNIAQGKDADARYKIRIDEMHSSLQLIDQALLQLESGPFNAIEPDELPPLLPLGTTYASVEGPRGELGVLLASDKGTRSLRVHVRAPSFANLSALPFLVRGERPGNLGIALDSLDISMGEAAR